MDYRGKRMRYALLALLVALAWARPAGAEETVIGSLRQVKEPAFILHEGQSLPAQPRQQIRLNDTLRTGPGGAMGAILRDDSVLSLGPNSELSLDEFAFAPVEDKLSLVGRLTRGTAAFLTGKIGQMRPEAVQVETPGGIIGVRGTQFLVQVGE